MLPLFNACGKYRAVGVHNNYGYVNSGQYARKIAGKVIRINCCRNPWRQFSEFLNYPVGSGRAFAVFKNIVGKGFKICFAVISKALGNNVKAVHIVAVQSLRIPRFGAEGERRHVNQAKAFNLFLPELVKIRKHNRPAHGPAHNNGVF